MHNNILLRAYRHEDADALAAIYYHTIHLVNTRDYTAEQVEAWAPIYTQDAKHWLPKWANQPPIVATHHEKVVGFAELERNGHIDCFYVHHEAQGLGVGSGLMAEIIKESEHAGVSRLFSEVSITAKPFFEHKGFKVVKEQTVNIRGMALINFVMEIDIGK